MKNKNIKYSEKGFTLLEMIIALAIFTIVALVAVGALLKIMDANAKSLSLKTTINNVNFALESISREMRVGSDYYCNDTANMTINDGNYSPGCAGVIDDNDWFIAFRSSKRNDDCNLIYAYKLANGIVSKAQQEDCNDSINNNSFQPLLSSDIVIENSIVEVDDKKVFLYLKGYSGTRARDRSDFEIQTSVSQRIR